MKNNHIKKYQFIDEGAHTRITFYTRKKLYYCLVDTEDVDKIKEKLQDFHLTYDTANFLFFMRTQLTKSYHMKISVTQTVLNTDKRVYYKNRDKTDLRKVNLTTDPKEVEGLSAKARENYFKQDKDKLVQGMRERRYTLDYSKLMGFTKGGELNVMAKLDNAIVEEVREAYATGEVSQTQLAQLFATPRSTIADIVNYRTWVGKENPTLRQYKKNITKQAITTSYVGTHSLYDRFEESNCLYLFDDDKVDIYIEKLPIDRLLYMEVRQNEKFVFCCDLYFPIRLSKGMKENYIIANRNPVKKTTTTTVSNYITKLENVL